MVRLENLVSKDHPYSTYIKLLDFRFLHKKLLPLEVEDRYKGYGVMRLFKCILLQFMEDLSDRQLMKFLQENNAGKWYCDFYLKETTPDYTVLSKMRSRPGTTLLSKIFAKFRK